MFNLLFGLGFYNSLDGYDINEKGLNVLSLFDGISAAQLALKRAGIKVSNYYSSEIDEYAIQVTQKNYPKTIQLGDIKNIRKKDIPEKIDIIIGGSPCQGFSLSGKQLNFQDPRSKLFFEFERLLNEIKPKYFLFENVMMKSEIESLISKKLGVNPIMVNSSLQSAQNRKRNYWTNISFELPSDKNIFLKDILINNENKIAVLRGRKDKNAKKYFQNLEIRKDNKSNTITTIEKDNYALNVKAIKKFNLHPSGKGMRGWVYDIKGKSPTLTTNKGEGPFVANEKFLRKLTTIECERLQTFPDNYTEGISNTQRYKALGNSFTVDIISHILKQIK